MTLTYYQIHNNDYYWIKEEEVSLKEVSKREWKIVWDLINSIRNDVGSSQHEKLRHIIVKRLLRFPWVDNPINKLSKKPFHEYAQRTPEGAMIGWDKKG
jgi:hypothetical protein